MKVSRYDKMSDIVSTYVGLVQQKKQIEGEIKKISDSVAALLWNNGGRMTVGDCSVTVADVRAVKTDAVSESVLVAVGKFERSRVKAMSDSALGAEVVTLAVCDSLGITLEGDAVRHSNKITVKRC